MKYVVVLYDGMADYPVPALDGKTPMMVANKPNLDYLAQRSEVGLVRTVVYKIYGPVLPSKEVNLSISNT